MGWEHIIARDLEKQVKLLEEIRDLLRQIIQRSPLPDNGGGGSGPPMRQDSA